MKSVTVDIGNSQVKIELWNEEKVLYRLIGEDDIDNTIIDLVNESEASGVIISSVRKEVDSLIKQLQANLNIPVINFNQEEIARYDDIHYEGNIGADRIAAFLGANVRLGNCAKLVLDAGTAITTDVVNADGEFCGGNISLGLKGRMNSLAQNTGLLPKIENLDFIYSFGFNTVSAIQSGVINGIVGELLYAIERAKKEYEIEWVVMTGGDIDKIMDNMPKIEIKCLKDPNLVGLGLNYHLRRFYLN